MTIETPILTMREWLFWSEHGWGALPIGGLALLSLFAVLLLGSFLVTVLQYGPVEAFQRVVGGFVLGIQEICQSSPRRIWANARLAFKEALRRKILVAVGVFALVLLFASWYLDVKSDYPARLYMGVVLGWTNLLILLLALFVSTFSLPTDVKNRTIYTLVTKPVRLGEIVLGRMIGFAMIGTLILALMCVFSYFFVKRGISHHHSVEVKSLQPDPDNVAENGELGLKGRTTEDAYHRHTVYVNADGKGYTDLQRGHRHEVLRSGSGANAKYTVGPPVGQLQARKPIYGELRFYDRRGNLTDKGINVGNEWAYRSYIEGGTLAAAEWTFDGVTPSRFPANKAPFDKGVPLELTLRVFRTHKGKIDRGILGSIEVVEYQTAVEAKERPPLISEPVNFYAQEFNADRKYIPRKLNGRIGAAGEMQNDLDLFEDFAHDGKLRIRIRCLDPQQYYGAAMPDVYLWAGEGSFFVNFVKGYAGIWFQMVLVIAFGVMFSTFLSGPVAMLATAMAYVMGFFSTFVQGVASGELEGGGPLESFIRMVEQRNLTSDFDPSTSITVVKGVDSVSMVIMQVFSTLMPNYSQFQTSSFVASGYSVPSIVLVQHLITTLVFVVVLSIVAYFFFRTREIAA